MGQDQQPAQTPNRRTPVGQLSGKHVAMALGALFAFAVVAGLGARSVVPRVGFIALGVGVAVVWAYAKFAAKAPAPLRGLAEYPRAVGVTALVLVGGGAFPFLRDAHEARDDERARQQAEVDAQQRKADVEAAAQARERFEKAVQAFAANEAKTVEALAAIENAVQQRPSEARKAFDEMEKFFAALDAATKTARDAVSKLAATDPNAGAVELPPNVAALKKRFDGARATLEKREKEVFDALYTALWPADADPEHWADQMGAVDDSAQLTGPEVDKHRAVVAAVARKLGLAVGEAKHVFLRIQSTGELDRRLEERKRTAPPEAKAIKVSATQLWKDYSGNEVAADEKYKGRALLVTGAVASVEKDVFGNIVVWLSTPNMFERVMAKVEDSEQAKAAQLGKGTTVKLLCAGGTRVLGSPTVHDCVVK